MKDRPTNFLTASISALKPAGQRTLLLTVCLFLATLANAAHAQDSLTISDVIQQVVKANNRVAAARFMERSAQANVGASASWPDPMLMIGLQNVPTNFDLTMDPMTMKMIGLSQEIPYSGYLGLQRKAARAQAAAATADRRSTEVDLVAAAKAAFIDVFYRQQSLADLRRQQELLDQIVSSATAKLRSNQATQDEVLAAQADKWRLESAVLSLQQEIDAARYNLNALRGMDPNAPLPVLASPRLDSLPDTVSVWLERAKQNYPPLQRLKSQAEGYRWSGAASNRMVWPMLTLDAEYGIRSGADLNMETGMLEPRDNMLTFRASFSLPIFSRGKQRSMARSMQAMSQSSTAEADQLWRDTEAAIRSLHARVTRLQQSLGLYQDRIIPAAEDAFRSALAGYTTNRTPFASLLNYEMNIYRDRITATQLATDLAQSLAEVEKYTADPSHWDESSQRKE